MITLIHGYPQFSLLLKFGCAKISTRTVLEASHNLQSFKLLRHIYASPTPDTYFPVFLYIKIHRLVSNGSFPTTPLKRILLEEWRDVGDNLHWCLFLTKKLSSWFLCRLRSIATHRDHFVRRLSVRLCVRLSVRLSHSHSYVSQATHAFLKMLPLFFR